jgi:lipoate---protein ligase
MPVRRAQRKVPGGKLVRLDADYDGHVLSHIHISGDFFIYPEEALTTIERELDASGLNGQEEDLEQRVGLIVSSTGADLVGFGTNDIVDLLRELRC